MKKHIPNFITLINLFCGCCALVFIFHKEYVPAFWFIFFGGLADYSDGLVARMLDVKSPLGKELDSMADMVTFGIVPGAIIYTLLADHHFLENYYVGKINWAAFPAFIISVFSGLRLARFNLDTRQSDDFIGLPVPSSTMFVTGLMLIYHFDSFGLRETVSSPYFLYPVIPILSYLLVAELPMFSMKFKGKQWKGNERRIIFLLLGITLTIFLKGTAFSIIVILYVLLSLMERLFLQKN